MQYSPSTNAIPSQTITELDDPKSYKEAMESPNSGRLCYNIKGE